MDKWLSVYLTNLEENNVSLTDDIKETRKSTRRRTPSSKLRSNQEQAEAISESNCSNGRNDNRQTTPQMSKTVVEKAHETFTESAPCISCGSADKNVTPTKNMKDKYTEEISLLKEELHKLKRRVRKLEHKERKAKVKPEVHSQDELSKLVEREKNAFFATKTLLCSLFTKQELISHSVSGKAANSKVTAKPRFDSLRYSVFVDIIHEKFPSLDKKEITAKVHAVQKHIQRENLKMIKQCPD